MIRLIQFFNRKYPFRHISIISIFIISFCVGSLLFILKPFGFVNYENNKIIAALGFSLVTFISLIFINLIKQKLIKPIIVKWTIFKELLFLNFVIFFITIGNYFYLSIIIEGFILSFDNLKYAAFLTFSIGIIPIAFITLFRYNVLKNNKLGVLINDDDTDDHVSETIKFNSLNKTDAEIVIAINDFLFVEAIKNNMHIYYYENNLVKTISVRNTLKKIDDQLQKKFLFRCHRSFIVNTNNIKTAKGNSNSYKIYFENYDHFVPVSRSYTKAFQDLIF